MLEEELRLVGVAWGPKLMDCLGESEDNSLHRQTLSREAETQRPCSSSVFRAE